MRAIALLSSLAFVLGSACGAEPAPAAQAPNAQATAATSLVVKLKVTGDEDLEKRFSDCLASDLEKIAGIKVGDAREALTFDVIIVKQKVSGGGLLGYIIYLGGYLPGPRSANPADASESQAVLVTWQTLRMAPPDLEAACHRAVRDYQDEIIGPVRSSIEKLGDALEHQGQR